MEFVNLGVAFSAGLLAVLAPCALPMLPSFVAYFLNSEDGSANWGRAVTFGVVTVTGFLTIFVVIGVLPSFALNSLARRIELAAPFIGVILMILGLGHLLSDFFYKIPVLQIDTEKNPGIKGFYLYGVGYGAASMACSFPVFVLLVFQASTTSGLVGVVTMFLVYGLGAAAVLVPLSVALTYSRDLVYQRLIQLMPHMKTINSMILIIAGLYMVLSFYL